MNRFHAIFDLNIDNMTFDNLIFPESLAFRTSIRNSRAFSEMPLVTDKPIHRNIDWNVREFNIPSLPLEPTLYETLDTLRLAVAVK
jgi:hypothetical protein